MELQWQKEEKKQLIIYVNINNPHNWPNTLLL